MASLVQDLWLGWEPRLRGRRLAPWDEPRVRLLFHLDAGATLDDAPLAAFLEALAERLEVVAWEPRGQGASAGHFGPEVLEDARRLVTDGATPWGSMPLVVGGHGLGGWLAIALADAPGVAAAFALAPSLAVESRERSAAEAETVSQWLLREPRASRLVAAGKDAEALAPPWPATVASWAESVGLAAGSRRA
jgi:hypothetical protein